MDVLFSSSDKSEWMSLFLFFSSRMDVLFSLFSAFFSLGYTDTLDKNQAA